MVPISYFESMRVNRRENSPLSIAVSPRTAAHCSSAETTMSQSWRYSAAVFSSPSCASSPGAARAAREAPALQRARRAPRPAARRSAPWRWLPSKARRARQAYGAGRSRGGAFLPSHRYTRSRSRPVLTPVGASVPRAALELPFEDIVFKHVVALGGGEPGKAGAQ